MKLSDLEPTPVCAVCRGVGGTLVHCNDCGMLVHRGPFPAPDCFSNIEDGQGGLACLNCFRDTVPAKQPTRRLRGSQLLETLHEAGYQHITTLRDGAHILRIQETGDLEVWYGNKYHAGYSIIYGNTALEFGRDAGEFERKVFASVVLDEGKFCAECYGRIVRARDRHTCTFCGRHICPDCMVNGAHGGTQASAHVCPLCIGKPRAEYKDEQRARIIAGGR